MPEYTTEDLMLFADMYGQHCSAPELWHPIFVKNMKEFIETSRYPYTALDKFLGKHYGDPVNLYDLLYQYPLEDMPLYINFSSKKIKCIIANWRLKIGK